jgi:hypothetical protein
MTPTFTLTQNARGRWEITLEDASLNTSGEGSEVLDASLAQQQAHSTQTSEVIVVRAFPIESPNTCVSILSTQGKEVLWIEDLEQLPAEQRKSVMSALTEREFMPEILKLERVSSFTTPSTWSVVTSRGSAQLELKGEEDIRRLSPKTLIVSDRYGVQYLIKDLPSLDRYSRKLLDRFF